MNRQLLLRELTALYDQVMSMESTDCRSELARLACLLGTLVSHAVLDREVKNENR